jgi:hypothetical protein
MFILGLCSIFQMIFLPGFLVLKPFKIDGIIRFIIFSFALSLTINYCMVLVLTVLGLYTRTMLFIIFVIEMLVFIKMVHPLLNQPIITLTVNSIRFRSSLLQMINEIKHNPSSLIQFIFKFTIMTLSAITILWYSKQFFTSIGQIFNDWDTVVSWNSSAITWYKNIFPAFTGGRYPQLLPINWSLTYIFTDSQVQLFAKPIMPLFSLFILFLMLDLAVRKKSFGYYISIILTGVLIKALLGEFITTGYADIPVAFFAFLSVYCLTESYDTKNTASKMKLLVLGAFFAGGAAVTKQPGVLIAFLYPFLSLFLILNKTKDMRGYDKFKIFIFILILMGLIVMPWYVYKQINIIKGLETDEVIANLNIDITKDALQVITSKIPLSYFFLMSIVIIFSFFNRIYKWITLTFILPIIFLWSFYFAYDIRNLAITIPLIGSLTGTGFENIFALAQKTLKKIRKSTVAASLNESSPGNTDTISYNIIPPLQQKPLIRIRLLEALIFVAAFLIIPIILYNRSFLIDRQIFLQKQIGYKDINMMLYNYQKAYGISGKIISNYQFLGHLPELDKFYDWEIFKNYEAFDKHRQNPDVHYILIFMFPDFGINQSIVNDIKNRIRTEEYQLIFSDKYDFVFFVRIK